MITLLKDGILECGTIRKDRKGLAKNKDLKLKDFLLSVVDELIGINCQKKRGRPCTNIPSIPATNKVKTPESIRTSVQKHLPGVYEVSSKRCSLCSTKTNRVRP